MFGILAQSDGVSDLFDGVTEGLTNAWQSVIEFIPKLIGALVILLVGWFIARLVRNGFERFFHRVGLDRLLDRAGLNTAMEGAGYTASGLTARVIYWMALLVVFLLAAQTLRIGQLSELLGNLIAYLPLVVAAIIILIVAAAIGSFIAELAGPFAEEHGVAWLPRIARWAVIGFGVFASLNTLNLAAEIVNILFLALVGTVAVTVAISFGVGGIKAAESWWTRMLPDRKAD